MTNESAYTTIERAAQYITSQTNADNGNDMFDAYHILMQAWKAVGPLGEIPSWELLEKTSRWYERSVMLSEREI